MNDKTLTYISLFSSAGVGCYGFKLNGFECVATNELLERRLEIQRNNKKCKYETGYISGDISSPEVKSKLLTEVKRWTSKKGVKEIDVLVATPPCQGMSVANHKKKDEKKRNSLVVESIKLTTEISPRFFIYENVRAFLKTICTDLDGKDKAIKDAINSNLAGKYNIIFDVINFKDYGSNSSRTRTLVIGVRKDLAEITPFDVFPSIKKPKTLRNLIGDLPPLTKMGEISSDIYHSFRPFKEHMLPWIETLEEGQSAFTNSDPLRIPHQIKDGKIVYNKSKNGDKYARWYWDRTGPCIHTRNDILASQNTIHPSDNRVFSVRELMRMMSIPDSFQWGVQPFSELNAMSDELKKSYLKKNEFKIRQCIGEAVPTAVFQNIAKKVKTYFTKKRIVDSRKKKLILDKNLSNFENLKDYISRNGKRLDLNDLLSIAEYSNAQRQHTAAYYTRSDIAYAAIKDLPDFKGRKTLRIIEPSVGVGNFIPLIINKYKNIEKVIIDVFDIDSNSLLILREFLRIIDVPSNFTINIHNEDFLTSTPCKCDLIIGNPPYKKLTKHKELLDIYRSGLKNIKTNNLFAFFIEKSLRLASVVSLIVPKSLLNSPEFDLTRDLIRNDYNIIKICDNGEKGFKGVKIETINLLVSQRTKKNSDSIIIESYIDNTYQVRSKNYILDSSLPYWLIYRDSIFDKTLKKMSLGVYKSFRDRQITKKHTVSAGKVRVIKSRNVKDNEVINLDGYDSYLNNVDNLSVSKFINQKNVVMIPNLTYYPRGAFLPNNCLADGSVALLTVKDGVRLPTKDDLSFYGTKEFQYYYKIARNKGTRSLNIDNNSVYFFGLLKEDDYEK